jgi:hypothetical protein
MTLDMSLIDVLVFWIRERTRVHKARESGAAPPWSDDELFQKFRFCNADVQHDHVSRVIFNLVTRPCADHPHLVIGLTVARFTNAPEVIEAVSDCLVPFNAERFVAIMSERAARGEILERRAFVIPGGVKGELKARNLCRKLFVPLAAAVERVRPRPGDTCEAVFERLRRFKYLKTGFITAQIVRDAKQAGSLRSASDWMSFVWSGPGSQRAANRMLGWTKKKDIDYQRPELEWRALFDEIVAIAAPRVAEDGIILDAQSWQNCFCECDKYLRFRSGDLRGARLYRPSDAPASARASEIAAEPEAQR